MTQTNTIPRKYFKEMAKSMALICVRNTIIEKYHADGCLSQTQMKKFNKEVVNKIYSYLVCHFSEDVEVQKKFAEIKGFFYPSNWDEPVFDKDFSKVMRSSKNQVSTHKTK